MYQRERVGESTEKIKPRQLISEAYRTDPYPIVGVLREHYPCYRDWLGNRFWVSRYDDVTSIFADDANFETRPKAWFYGMDDYGRDFGAEVPVLEVEARVADERAAALAEALCADLTADGGGNLATRFAAALPLQLLGEELALPDGERERFASLYWRAQRGVSWQPELQADGRAALGELETLLEPLLRSRLQAPQEDLISVLAGLGASVRDVVRTLLERDQLTLHGALANLWRQLLTDADACAAATSDARMMKLAYLETLRHSAPVVAAQRYARHEVERFGRLLPEGALIMCSAAAANRDPRAFADPDAFIVDRREPLSA